MKLLQWDVNAKHLHLLVTTDHVRQVQQIEFLSEMPKSRSGAILSRFDFECYVKKHLSKLQNFIVEHFSLCRIAPHRDWERE